MKCRFLKPNIKHEVLSLNTVRTLSKYGVFSGPYFPDLGVNTVFSPNTLSTSTIIKNLFKQKLFFKAASYE